MSACRAYRSASTSPVLAWWPVQRHHPHYARPSGARPEDQKEQWPQKRTKGTKENRRERGERNSILLCLWISFVPFVCFCGHSVICPKRAANTKPAKGFAREGSRFDTCADPRRREGYSPGRSDEG